MSQATTGAPQGPPPKGRPHANEGGVNPQGITLIVELEHREDAELIGPEHFLYGENLFLCSVKFGDLTEVVLDIVEGQILIGAKAALPLAFTELLLYLLLVTLPPNLLGD